MKYLISQNNHPDKISHINLALSNDFKTSLIQI